MPKYPAILSRGTFSEEIDSYSGLVSAPGPYMEFGEFIYLEASSTDASCTLRISGKFLSTDNEIRSFNEDMTITGTGNQTAVTSRIGPCWLMGFSVRVVAGTITDGEVVASVHIARASASTPVHVMTLASGEVTNTRSLGLGGFTGASKDPLLAYTAASVVTVANPAAGADWSTTVPASTDWDILNIFARITASATVASRDPELRISSGGAIIGNSAPTQALAAGNVWDMSWQPNSVLANGAGETGFTFNLPLAPATIPTGATIETKTYAIQAGDQWSNIRLVVRAHSI